jgi:hypothetical protein
MKTLSKETCLLLFMGVEQGLSQLNVYKFKVWKQGAQDKIIPADK